MHILEEKIRAANAQGRFARIPFLTAGYPDPTSFWPTLLELDENGADIIEIGVPFSDPVADGPVVESCSREALQNGVNLSDLLKDLEKRANLFHAGIVLMGYYNPFLQYGLEALAKQAIKSHVQGFIVPDLPLEEAEPMRTLLDKESLALIPLVGPNTTKERMQAYATVSQGYAYVVSVMGVTGARKELPAQVCETLLRAKESFSIPVALGFGLQNPTQLAMIPKNAKPDAVVFGSALLKTLQQGKSATSFLKQWS